MEITQTDQELQQDTDAYIVKVVKGLIAIPEKLQ